MSKNIKTKLNTYVTYLLVIVLVGAGMGVAGGVLKAKSSPQSVFELRGPKTYEELVRNADLIVLGTVVSVVDKGTFYGYDKDASRKSQLDKKSPGLLGLPFVDYKVEVEQMISGEISGDVILRTLDNPDTSTSLATIRLGDKRLFFLRRNPDRRTYGLPSVVNQIDVEGPIAVYYKGSSALFPFGEKVRPSDLLDRVERVSSRVNENRTQ